MRSQTVANDVIADKCDKAQSKVLDRPGPTKRDRWDWWMDIGVRDANFTDALWHLNSLLDLAHWLVTVSKGQNRLDGWLNLEELEKVQIDCKNRANDVIGRLHSRVNAFFTAIASCQSQAMDEAILQLSGDQSEEEAASVDNSEDGASEVALDDALDMRAAIKVACRELKEILQLLSRPASYAALFDATCDQAESTPRDSFHDLELLFQSMYMECQINFGDEETEPVVRQKALSCLFEFNRALPSDKAFEGYKKIFQSTYQHLYNQHQLAKKGELSALRGKFANHVFDEESARMMERHRIAAQADPKARVAYEVACNDLARHVRVLLEHVSLSFTHLKYPEQSFRAQDHLVKPWNQLQDTQRFLREFLDEASGGTKIDLERELAGLVERFEEVFKDEVLQPFAKMFDLGEYASAEGDNIFGLQRVHDLTAKIEAQGGKLGQVICCSQI